MPDGHLRSPDGRCFAIRDGMLVGRSPECGLLLTEPDVSRFHARLEILPGGIRLSDLGSRNGTTVNGERIVSKIVTAPAEISFASSRWTFVSGDLPPDGEAESGPVIHVGYTGVIPGPSHSIVELAGLRTTKRSIAFYLLFALAALLWAPCVVLNFLAETLMTGPVTALYGAIITLVPTIPVLVAVLSLDRNHRLRPAMAVSAFLWGGIVAVGAALVVNTIVGTTLTMTLGVWGEFLTAPLVAPPVEETSKGLLLLLFYIFLSDRFDNSLDGLVYGATVGIGFAVIENLHYFLQTVSSGGVGFGTGLVVIRTFMMIGGHPVYTAATGLGLGLAREFPGRWWRIVFPPMGLLTAICLHGIWNLNASVPSVISGDIVIVNILLFFVLTIFFFAAYLAAVGVTLLRERAVVVKYLSEDPFPDVVTAGELAGFVNPARRFVSSVRSLFTEGPVRWHLRRSLRRAQVRLAVRKWQLERGERRRGGLVDRIEKEARERIRRLRTRLLTLAESE